MCEFRRIALGLIVIVFGAVNSRGDDKLVLSRIAFGSCARQDKPQPIWEPIVATRPDIYLSLGDTIYGDTVDMALMKKKYDMLAAIPGWQKLTKTCPILATWDDHDYGVNDGGE